MRFVIVGGGIAGTTCAEELRKLAPESEITLISEETHPIYSRVLLPHYIKSKVPRERVFLKAVDWYETQRIEWITGVRVESLDPKNAHVALSDGRELPYDKLLIAIGGEVQSIAEDLRGVSYLHTLDDADHLLQLLGERAPGSRGAVWGGGFIACEYLNIFAHNQMPTTIAFRGPWFWSRVLDPESGALLNERMRSHGVEVIPEAKLEQLEGEGELTGMRLQTSEGTREIACSILGVGVGIKSEASWIAAAGIEVGTAVRTNEFLETNVQNVYAAGDGAEFLDLTVSRTRQVGTWQNAMTQGRTIAKTMAGTRTPFRLVSSYATNALGLEIIFVGDVDRGSADEIQVVGTKEAGGVTQLFLRGEKTVGATIIGRNQDRMPITRAIQEGTPPPTLV